MPTCQSVARRLYCRALFLLAWNLFGFVPYVALFNRTPQTAAQDMDAIATPAYNPGLIRIDFSITTNVPTSWKGEIKLSRGAFSNPVPLGTAASSGTDFFFSDSAQNCLILDARSPENFCGVETTITAPRDSQIDLNLWDRTNNRRYSKVIFVDRLVDSSTSIQLDNGGGKIEIIRAPADELPVLLRKPNADNRLASSLLHSNETLILSVFPRSSASKLSSDLVVVASARRLDTNETFWSDSRNVPLSQIRQNDAAARGGSGDFSPCNFSVVAPNKPGVFEIVVELRSQQEPNAQPKLSLPLPPLRKSRAASEPLARRIIQCVVLSSAQITSLNETVPIKDDRDLRGELLDVIDPSNSSWKKAFSKRRAFPFTKSTPSMPNPDKSSGTFRSTFANNENAPTTSAAAFAEADHFNSSRFQKIEPLVDTTGYKSDASNSRLTLGQSPSPSSLSIPSFGVNIFSFGKPDASKLETEQLRAYEKISFIQNWERNGFNTFLRSLDRKAWLEPVDLLENTLSSGNSRNFTPEELKQFAPPQINFVRLAPNNSRKSDGDFKNDALELLSTMGIHADSVSWEAYPIPIQEPGKPHLLEVEYPSNFPQKLGVTILERSFSGALLPSFRDAGVVVDDNPFSDRSEKSVSKYAVLFWPRTKTPIILLSNCSQKTPAAYGQIRVYLASGVEQKNSTQSHGRLFGLSLSRPNVCDQFSAERKPSYFGLEGAEDWKSFDDAFSRVTYYLSAFNYDGTALTVVADGSSIYPSKLINPNPKYDGGIFLPTGGDQERKDALSLALSKFDAKGLALIPVVKLNSTIPKLEQKLRSVRTGGISEIDRANLEGIEWIGPDARRLIDSRRDSNGGGPYYNILHPEVEKAVVSIVQELIDKCAPHNSFEGLGLDVGASGWLALPDDVYYGMDDETIARFVRESNLENVLIGRTGRSVQELLLPKGAQRYSKRAEFIRDVCLDEWINWRVDALYNFYRKIREAVSSARPDVRLYLIATNAVDGPFCQATLYPSLTSPSRLRDALRLTGLDPVRYADPSRRNTPSDVVQSRVAVKDFSRLSYDPKIVLLRPEIIAETASFEESAIQEELASPDAISLFGEGQIFPGSIFTHRSKRERLYDFDLMSPFPATAVELNALAIPANYENRRRFARTLAVSDCLCFFDGGDTVPFGQETALGDWVYAFRNLPAATFRTWTPKREKTGKISESSLEGINGSSAPIDVGGKTTQPIVARFYRNEKEAWFYFLNAAPFHVNVKATFTRNNKASFEIFSSASREAPLAVSGSLVWNYTATPYDLAVIRIDDPRATLEMVEAACPSEICGNDGRMRRAVQDFINRVVIAKKGLELPFRNGNFEENFSNGIDDDPSRSSSIKGRQEKANLLGLDMPQMSLFAKNRKATNSINAELSKRSSDSNENGSFQDASIIPGWQAFGPNDVDIILDTDNERVKEGRASLKIASKQSSGGVVSQPFAPPTTGRLCAQICFGIRNDAVELPLDICLTGRIKGSLFIRRIHVGSALMKKLRSQKSEDNPRGITWLTEVVLFDRLPLDGLDNLSLRVELNGKGEAWLDDVRLFSLAFASSEQTQLMKLINATDYRASQNRVLDVMFMLDSYWGKLLKNQIPDDSPLMSSRAPIAETALEISSKPNVDKAGEENNTKGGTNSFWNKLKRW